MSDLKISEVRYSLEPEVIRGRTNELSTRNCKSNIIHTIMSCNVVLPLLHIASSIGCSSLRHRHIKVKRKVVTVLFLN